MSSKSGFSTNNKNVNTFTDLLLRGYFRCSYLLIDILCGTKNGGNLFLTMARLVQ